MEKFDLTILKECSTILKMRKLLAFLTVLVVLPLLTMEAEAPRSNVKPPKFSKTWFGMASWYGDHWKGRKTAVNLSALQTVDLMQRAERLICRRVSQSRLAL